MTSYTILVRDSVINYRLCILNGDGWSGSNTLIMGKRSSVSDIHPRLSVTHSKKTTPS